MNFSIHAVPSLNGTAVSFLRSPRLFRASDVSHGRTLTTRILPGTATLGPP
jgi:hypothetical protein